MVTGCVMPVVSHSWKASVPMADGGTWPVMHDHRDRVHVGVAQRRDDVGGRRAAGHHGHAGAAGGVGVALGHVAGALLVAHEDVADRRVDDRVVHRQDGAAGQAEDDLDALHLEAAIRAWPPLICIGFSRRIAAENRNDLPAGRS